MSREACFPKAIHSFPAAWKAVACEYLGWTALTVCSKKSFMRERINPKVVAIVGSYRKSGIVDSAVDAILAGASAKGAETRKIYLLDKRIEFCTNCRCCTQMEGEQRGRCVQRDDLESILAEIQSANAIVLGAPVNFYNLNALFRRFMERLVVASIGRGAK